MSDASVFATVALAHALAVLSPGPDFAIVIRQSLVHGRAAGVWTAAGIGSGILFHVAYGLFGLGWALQTWPGLLRLVGLVGAAFLIWIGSQSLRAQPLATSGGESPPPATGGSFGLGLATNVLNPKAMLFFIALFSTVISSAQGWGVRLAIGLWLPLATFAWFATLALMLSHGGLRERLRRSAHWLDRAMGLLLVALGLAMFVRDFLNH